VATVTIPLTRGQQAIIDEEDLPLVGGHNWHAVQNQAGDFYAVRTENMPDGSRRRVAMHRLIAGAVEGEEVDHWDLNTLNNIRTNLRRCTKTQNHRNRPLRRDSTSGYKGVTFNPKRVANPWQTYIGTKETRKSLGSYNTAEEAAEAYNRAAIDYYGEFARLNVIDYGNPIPRPQVERPIIPRPSVPKRKGVTFDAETGKWRACTYIDGKRVTLGRFDTIDEAGCAYDEAKQRHRAPRR
jgi:hypothetical protein